MIRPLVAQATARCPNVTVFGEMVVLLWQQRRYAAAIRLEMLWNDLAS